MDEIEKEEVQKGEWEEGSGGGGGNRRRKIEVGARRF